MLLRERNLVLSIVAGVTVPAFLYVAYRVVTGPCRHSKSHVFVSAIPIVEWNFQQVCVWLATQGVSPRTIAMFAQSAVDGQRLMTLSVNELVEMGISLYDRKLILALLADVEGPAKRSAAVTAAGGVAPQAASFSPEGTPALLTVPLNTFLSDANHFFMDLIFPKPIEGDGATAHYRVRALMASRLYDLIASFHSLSREDQQTAMLPLARQLNAILVAPPVSHTRSPLHNNTAEEALSPPLLDTPTPLPFLPKLRDGVRPLHDMLDKFISVLQPSLTTLPLDELRGMSERVKGLVSHVLQVTNRLPSPLKEELLAKCKRVLELLETALSPESPVDQAEGLIIPPGDSAAVPPGAESAATMLSLQGRLHAIFARIKDPTLLEMVPDQRLKLIEEMMTEVQCIDDALQEEDTTHAHSGRAVAAQVRSILQQMLSFTNEDERLLQEKDTEDSASALEKGKLSVIHQALANAMEVLTSAKLASTPAEMKQGILQKLCEHMLQLRDETAQLQDEEREETMKSIDYILQTLCSHLSPSSVDNGEEKKAAEGAGDSPEEGDSGAKGSPPEDQQAAVAKLKLADVVKQIEYIFAFFSSQRFQKASPAEMHLLAGEFQQKVAAAKAEVLKYTDSNNPIVQKLILPLEELLTNILTTLNSSELFESTMDTLKRIHQRISSPAFQEAEHSKKDRMARIFITQLQRVISTFDKLPVAEQFAAEKLVREINQILMRVILNKDAGSNAVMQQPDAMQTEEDDPAKVRVIGIMARLQDVMSGIQSKDFIEATSKERQRKAVAYVAELEELESNCAVFKSEECKDLVNIIARLLLQLRRIGAITDDPANAESLDDDAAEVDAEERDDTQRAQLFQTIQNITSNLRQGTNGDPIILTETQLRTLWELLSVVDNVEDMSDNEAFLRDSFETELQLASQSAEAGKLADPSTMATAQLDENASALATQQARTEDPNHPNETGDDALTTDDTTMGDRLASLITIFHYIQQALESRQFTSIEELLPFMTAANNALMTAEANGIDWRLNDEAVDTVMSVLNKLQDLQGLIESDPDVKEPHALDEPRPLSSEQPLEQTVSTAVEESPLSSPADCDRKVMEGDVTVPAPMPPEQLVSEREEYEPESENENEVKGSFGKLGGEAVFSEDNDKSYSPVDGHSTTCSKVLFKPLPGGLANEFTLLPKIEERISKPTEEFIRSCTLFDIQCISKVLLHLSTEGVDIDPEIKRRVNHVAAQFIIQLHAFNASEHQSADALASPRLCVTGEDITSEGGHQARHLVVFTPEESASFPVNETLVQSLQSPTDAVCTTVHDEVMSQWEGKSIALIVLVATESSEMKQHTALSEIIALQEILAKRYEFECVTVTDFQLAAHEMERVLLELMGGTGLIRLLVYYYSPALNNDSDVSQAVTFHDNSRLEHRNVLKLTAAVERVVVVHSTPRSLEVACRFGEHIGPAMSVSITLAASHEVEKRRCWLYESLFTPILVELLSHDERPMLCPEDLINYAVTAMTRLSIPFGSFIGSASTSMGFFIPFSME